VGQGDGARDRGGGVTLLLISGRPGAGKSRFCQWLATDRGFVHIETDLPTQWAKWSRFLGGCTLASAKELSRDLRRINRDVAFEWGFAPDAIDCIGLFRKAGFEPWWFDGDDEAAWQGYQQREGPVNPEAYELQVERIQKSWKAIEREFRGPIIQNVSAGPIYLPSEEVAGRILVNWLPGPRKKNG
jgi:hypothetical protein